MNHLEDVLTGGWPPYRYAPKMLNIYWTSLLFLDVTTALLLVIGMRAGILLAFAVMATDLLVNIAYHLVLHDVGSGARGIVLLQVLFGIFVFANSPHLYRSMRRKA